MIVVGFRIHRGRMDSAQVFGYARRPAFFVANFPSWEVRADKAAPAVPEATPSGLLCLPFR